MEDCWHPPERERWNQNQLNQQRSREHVYSIGGQSKLPLRQIISVLGDAKDGRGLFLGRWGDNAKINSKNCQLNAKGFDPFPQILKRTKNCTEYHRVMDLFRGQGPWTRDNGSFPLAYGHVMHHQGRINQTDIFHWSFYNHIPRKSVLNG